MSGLAKTGRAGLLLGVCAAVYLGAYTILSLNGSCVASQTGRASEWPSVVR